MRKFGLIGFPLKHSFSKQYFTQKFSELGLDDHFYEKFEMETVVDSFEKLWEDEELVGVNVTIPHKQNVMPYLSRLDKSAERVGAVNVIKREADGLVGFNSDYYGFQKSVLGLLGAQRKEVEKALLLGTGGASKAILVALEDIGIEVKGVSRDASKAHFTYERLKDQPEMIREFGLIVNSTPLGTFPKVDECPDIPYDSLGENHFLFDVVYNPAQTKFLSNGVKRGAKGKNGLEMLELQAEKSWEIWNS